MTRTLLGLSAGLFAFLIAAASAQPEPRPVTMTDFDTDANSMVSSEEFSAGFGKGDIYKRWDADQSGTISSGEFNANTFRLFDRDRDSNLDQGEFSRFNEASTLLLPEGSAPLQIAAFDANTDSKVSAEEFSTAATGMGDQSGFAAFDTDKSGDISQEEFAAGAFRVYDRDRNGNLSQDEFTRFEEDTAFMQQQVG